MKRIVSAFALLGLISGLASAAGFNEPSGWDNMFEGDMEATVFMGIFQGGDVATGVISSDGESNDIKTDDGTMIGVRFGKDSTTWGWEMTLATAFADENLTNYDGTSTGNANWYFLNADLMLYPFGDDCADGTLQPYVCAGPGLAYYSSDTDALDSKALFDMNIGTGTAITISEDLPELRLDYRWHFIGGSEYDRSTYTELTLGVTLDF